MTPEIIRSAVLSSKAIRSDVESLIAVAGDQPQRFWELLREEVAKRLPVSQSEPAAMSEEEAARFEREIMRYGKYTGEEVREVPESYLIFLAEGDDFTKTLRRYVASKRFYQRQGEVYDDADA